MPKEGRLDNEIVFEVMANDCKLEDKVIYVNRELRYVYQIRTHRQPFLHSKRRKLKTRRLMIMMLQCYSK